MGPWARPSCHRKRSTAAGHHGGALQCLDPTDPRPHRHALHGHAIPPGLEVLRPGPRDPGRSLPDRCRAPYAHRRARRSLCGTQRGGPLPHPRSEGRSGGALRRNEPRHHYPTGGNARGPCPGHGDRRTTAHEPPRSLRRTLPKQPRGPGGPSRHPSHGRPGSLGYAGHPAPRERARHDKKRKCPSPKLGLHQSRCHGQQRLQGRSGGPASQPRAAAGLQLALERSLCGVGSS